MLFILIVALFTTVDGGSVYSLSTSSLCWTEREKLLSKLAHVFSTRNTSTLSSIFSDNIVFDITESGGPGPFTNIDDLAPFFELLQMVVRTQTITMTNILSDSCPDRNPVLAQFHSIQSMDQVFQPGDLYLPAIITGTSASIQFSPMGDRISSLVLLPGVTQIIISPQMSGVGIPQVKKKNVREGGGEDDAKMWAMLQAWIARSNPQMANYLQHTNEYLRLSALFNK